GGAVGLAVVGGAVVEREGVIAPVFEEVVQLALAERARAGGSQCGIGGGGLERERGQVIAMAGVFMVAKVEVDGGGHLVGVDEALGRRGIGGAFVAHDDEIGEVLQGGAGELAAQATAAGLQVFQTLHALAAIARGEDDGRGVGAETVACGGLDGELADGFDGGAVHGGFLWWRAGGKNGSGGRDQSPAASEGAAASAGRLNMSVCDSGNRLSAPPRPTCSGVLVVASSVALPLGVGLMDLIA